MYETCVLEELKAVKGAKKIRIAIEVFIYWRHYYRLKARKQLFDQKIKELKDKSKFYANEEKSVIECCNLIT